MSVVLGLTGSIGMGKSTTAGFFRELAVPVWDADAAVHALYARGGAAVAPLAALHPAACVNDAIDRSVLKSWIAADPGALAQIEQVVHPLVAAARAQFLSDRRNSPLVVLDIPLLFESGNAGLCDATLVVSAPPEQQRARVLARPGMDVATFEMILAKQMPDAEKRKLATYVIETRTPEQTRAEVTALVAALTGQSDA